MEKEKKYIEVKLLNGVKCMIYVPYSPLLLNEVIASNAIEGIEISREAAIKAVSEQEIPFPTYHYWVDTEHEEELKIGDFVKVPVGDSSFNEAEVYKIVDKPPFGTRCIDSWVAKAEYKK